MIVSICNLFAIRNHKEVLGKVNFSNNPCTKFYRLINYAYTILRCFSSNQTFFAAQEY